MKRSLITLLLDLSPADLRAVAEAWNLTLTRRTHADNVALVFAAMTDRWGFDDLFDALPESSQSLLTTLVTLFAGEVTPDALHTLAADEPGALSEALPPLEAALLVIRSADGTLSVPRELSTLVSRIVRDAGSDGEITPSLEYLLASLDVNILADAARLWGVPDVIGSARPGERERLIAALRHRTRSARACTDVERSLSERAQRVVGALRETTGTLPLNDVMARVDAQTPTIRRALLRELTTSLLVWDMRVQGTRMLLLPAPFRVLGTVSLPPLVAVAAEIIGAWQHPYALAWDLLTLLRLIERGAIPAAPGGLAALAENYSLAREFAPQFWVGRENPTPPAAALAFFATLAEARGLLTTDDGAQFTLHDAVTWAKQPFTAQTYALFTTWVALSTWSEGRGASVALWGVHWPTFRERLLDVLKACGVGQWHTLENLLARLIAVRPALLGEGFTAAGAVGNGQPDRDALTRICAEATLRSALTWFGIVVWGRTADGQLAWQLTAVGRWLLDSGPEPHLVSAREPPFAVDVDGRIRVRHAEPPHLWPLLAFADAETLGHLTTYRVTAGTLRRALRRDVTLSQVIRFLTGRAGGEIPEALRADFAAWASSLRRVTLAPAVLLTMADVTFRAELLQLLRAVGAEIDVLPNGRLLVQHPDGTDALAAALATAGVTTVWREAEADAEPAPEL